MIQEQYICNTASCREVRKDIGRFLEELKQPGTKYPDELVQKVEQWHHQIGKAESAQDNPILQLQERIKELNCLYSVIEALQTSRPDLDFDETIRKTLDVIPDGFQHPGRTGVALQVGDDRYATPLFTQSGQSLVTTCTARDGTRIELHISQLPGGDCNGSDTPFFLDEELTLLQRIVRLIRRFYHHHLNMAGLAEREMQLRANLREKEVMLAEIDFKSYITELADFIRGYFDRCSRYADFHFDLDPVQLDVNRAVPCGIIVNEILTNGLKYAFAGREHGRITLSLRQSNGEIRLTYRDDGVGMPQETLEQLRTGRAPSLGLELITALTRQLNGTLDISSDGGTRIALRFPGGGE
jgi:anti-sigma regulatory factor (Ser/Thr protein kinase)